ncbi:LxmA leader domain family RiPP [Streptomyces brasiliscabiei]|uniref:LxmA leader domain family RiPP n=1 Tax=Streptomyces brasiliscabiei TaxID=2736302 RepID=UPI001C12925A|nr:LxmA leader domain family RiPP [Streptomyces brasiliscabiei]
MTAIELMEGYSAYTTLEDLGTSQAAQSDARSVTTIIVTSPGITVSIITTAFDHA